MFGCIEVSKMTSRQALWAREWRMRLLQQFGNKCNFCDQRTFLEFAHIKPTKLKGEGRGMTNRIKDIRDNPDSYMLTCHKHNGLAEQ
jgi:hypothetical protein